MNSINPTALIKILFFLSGLMSVRVAAEVVALELALFKHIQFKGIPPTVYENSMVDGSKILKMKVASSSSFLVLAFDSPKMVSALKVLWNIKGSIKVRSHQEEMKKNGDDFPLRIGLAVYGPKPWIPFLAPSWVKLLGDSLKHSSDKLQYYVLGSQAKHREEWKSPYSDSMQYLALDSANGTPWQTAQHQHSAPLKVVGIWIMADGDQTSSSFEVELGKLEIE